MSDNTGRPDRDPGDAVPPGVAPLEPVPLTQEDREVLEKLEHLGETELPPDEAPPNGSKP